MEYFSLPDGFAVNAIATLVGVIGIILSIRIFPVMWKYLVQFFGKRGA
jgi:xanthosine utilization system XapX-like protein